MLKWIGIVSTLIGLVALLLMFNRMPTSTLPLIAIANYGPQASLAATIDGVKAALAEQGYIEHKTVRYAIQDVNFDPSLIPQMVTHLKNESPKVMVVMTTPVAQFAKGVIHDIPLVYAVVTDPVEAGLIKHRYQPGNNITGSSDQQDLNALLVFAKQLLPHAYRVGLLYATAEANDVALVRMMKKAAKKMNIDVVALPIESPRDVPMRMQHFKNKVDFIYVGSSGPIQPTLPVIAAEALKMKIPVFDFDESAVREGLALGSLGVSYHQVGVNAGKLVAQVLQGKKTAQLKPVYPSQQDSHGVVNLKQAHWLGIAVPPGVEVVGG